MYWSNSSFKGSQHSVDSKHFPLEIVLIHLNKKYKEPTNKPDAGLALSVLFQIKKDDNERLDPLFDNLKNIKYACQNSTLSSSLRIKDILPRNPYSYIKYFGSLLHPPCHQAITWIVFRHSNTVSENQLAKLRMLRSTKKDEKPEKLITKNSRSIQDLNDRKIITTLRLHHHWEYPVPSSLYDW
ncbi:carbonic anhydrase 2-like [Centruroides sculpturatus]|uniref:carbonic anhydrase 2-like n=1 Tax=Centruroides sculpturatus TaxID=218467 RepID=UPI000C6E250B|nr:carbonic anhydrase 2-like [Centruroides sculpturatus]